MKKKKTTREEKDQALKLIQKAQEHLENFDPFVAVKVAEMIQEKDDSVTLPEAIGEAIQYSLDEYKLVKAVLALRIDVDMYKRIKNIFSYFDSHDFLY